MSVIKKRMGAASLLLLMVGWQTVLSGCTKSAKEITAAATPPAPQEAAVQLQQAFTNANAETKGIAMQRLEGYSHSHPGSRPLTSL